ncbi:hypothetical protein [Halobacillus litoralis]|uniref:hypothetical protein n=1 Tax=Halobacillus litoralis TaxID=45668 RepID=UPI000FFB684D|nr:hypothetical protein [Halobacillus litoralis]
MVTPAETARAEDPLGQVIFLTKLAEAVPAASTHRQAIRGRSIAQTLKQDCLHSTGRHEREVPREAHGGVRPECFIKMIKEAEKDDKIVHSASLFDT